MPSIYVKNLSGDLIPLEVPSEYNLQVVLDLLHSIDPVLYPLSRTILFRVPSQQEEDFGDSKEIDHPFQEGEIISVFVSDAPTIEKGTFPIGGQPYVRFVIPIAEKTLYIYRNFMFSVVTYGMSLSPVVTRPSDSHGYARTLYDAVRAIHPDVTPDQMLDIYDVVFPYLEQEALDHRVTLTHEFNPKEPILCECGSLVQRSSLRGHQATKKHKLFMKSQKAHEA